MTEVATTKEYQIGSLEEKWENVGPDDEHGQTEATTQLYDLAVSGDPVFWFLKDFNTTEDPAVEFLWGKYSRLTEVNAFGSVKMKALAFSENGPWAKFTYTTERGSERQNEDFLLVYPLGPNRFVTAVFDGASSQKPISGLEKWKVSGAFYISHLAGMGFPTSEEFKASAGNREGTAFDFVKSLNGWLKKELEKVQGVDYKDVLTIPGMAATVAIVDYDKGNISMAHIADTVGIAEYSGSYKILTDNKNEKFDQETLGLVQKIAGERKLPLREAAMDPRVQDQLKTSFKKKINAPGGCGILNGMPELIDNNLVQTIELPITEDLVSLHLGSDGFYMPYLGNVRVREEFQMRKLLGAVQFGQLLRDRPMLDFTKDQLDMDPDWEKIPRLKRQDDATYLGISFGRPQSKWALENQVFADLFASGNV